MKSDGTQWGKHSNWPSVIAWSLQLVVMLISASHLSNACPMSIAPPSYKGTMVSLCTNKTLTTQEIGLFALYGKKCPARCASTVRLVYKDINRICGQVASTALYISQDTFLLINIMLRCFSRLQVATACFSCSPPDLNFFDPYFIFMSPSFHIYVHA